MLNQIIQRTIEQIELEKSNFSISELKRSRYFSRDCYSLKDAILKKQKQHNLFCSKNAKIHFNGKLLVMVPTSTAFKILLSRCFLQNVTNIQPDNF